MDYLIVSAATKNSVYEGCIYLQRKAYGKDQYHGMVVPCRGSWFENTKIKPDAIREGFKKSDVVLWIDADCHVDPPKGLPPGNWDVCLVSNIRLDHKIRFSAGFILFRDTKKTRLLLEIWEHQNRRARKDHPALKNALNIMKGKLNVEYMDEWLKGRQTVNRYLPNRGIAKG